MRNPSRIPGPATRRCGSISLLILLASFAFLPATTFAGQWRVAPIKLELGSNARSGVVNIVNEGTGKFQVQMKAFLWEQDSDGKDRLTETGDLIFFPRMMVFEKPEERILRAGIKLPATTKEKTYRLFIEEIPEPKKAEGTNIAVAIRFGVPVFVKPLQEDPKGELAKIELVGGDCRVTVKNSGNVHFIIQDITINGKGIQDKVTFTQKIDGWYLLNGASRVYTAKIPKQACMETTSLSVKVNTNRFSLYGTLDVDKTMCN